MRKDGSMLAPGFRRVSPSRQKGMVEGPNNGRALREELFPGWAHVVVARKESRAHTGQN